MNKSEKKYTRESLHYGEVQESVLRPGIKTASIVSVKLRGAWPNNFWHLAYAPGDRVYDMDAPAKWLRPAKEHIWRFLHSYITETKVIEEDKFCVIDDQICEFPQIIIKRSDMQCAETIEYRDWHEAEKKYRELTRRFKLIKKPY